MEAVEGEVEGEVKLYIDFLMDGKSERTKMKLFYTLNWQ